MTHLSIWYISGQVDLSTWKILVFLSPWIIVRLKKWRIVRKETSNPLILPRKCISIKKDLSSCWCFVYASNKSNQTQQSWKIGQSVFRKPDQKKNNHSHDEEAISWDAHSLSSVYLCHNDSHIHFDQSLTAYSMYTPVMPKGCEM